MTQVNQGSDNYLRPSTLAQVRTKVVAQAAAGSVGSYAFLIRNTAYVVFGDTYGGGGLRPAGLSSTDIVSFTTAYTHDDEHADLYLGPGTDTANVSGTWRCMGQTTAAANQDRGVTLFLRIS